MRAQACALALLATGSLVTGSARLAAAGSAGYCAPPVDTVPPAITAVSLSTRSIDLSKGARNLTVRVDAEDRSAGAISGVHRIRVDAYRGHEEKSILLALRSGTVDDGKWVGSFRFTRHNLSGHWVLRLFQITDRAGNEVFYIRNLGAAPDDPYDPRLHPEWDQTFTVSGTPGSPPRRPGRPLSLTITPRSVEATKHARTVRVATSFTGPAPRHVQFQLGGNEAGSGRFVGRIQLVRHRRVWTGDLPVGRWEGTETAKVLLIERFHRDVRPTDKFFYPSTLEALGLADKVKIVSGKDTSRPTLTDFSFTPSSVDTTTQSQTVDVSAKAADAQSGVVGIYVRFEYGTSKVQPISAGPMPLFHLPTNDLGTSKEPFVRLVRNGDAWHGTLTIPGCGASGSWKAGVYVLDASGRHRDYDDEALRKAGLPDDLEVTSHEVDTDRPGVTDASVDATSHAISLTFDPGVFNVSPAAITIYPATPVANRYRSALPIDSIDCSEASTAVTCDGSAGAVTTAVLHVPSVVADQTYQVWINLDQVVPQIVDAEGYPIDPEYGPQGVATPAVSGSG